MDLAPLGVHHDSDGEALVLVEPAHAADDLPVPLAVPVAHVEARHVHSADGQRLQLGLAAGGGAQGADELGAARAPEPVLPQLGLRDGIDADAVLRARGGLGHEEAVGVGERGEVGVGRACAGSDEAVRPAGGGQLAELRGGERRVSGGGGGGGEGLGRREVEEGVGGGHGGGGDAGGARRILTGGFGSVGEAEIARMMPGEDAAPLLGGCRLEFELAKMASA